MQLLHVTRIASLESIMRDGIRASKRGIFSVNGSNRAGIYAIHNDLDILRRLIARCFLKDNPEDLIEILFFAAVNTTSACVCSYPRRKGRSWMKQASPMRSPGQGILLFLGKMLKLALI